MAAETSPAPKLASVSPIKKDDGDGPALDGSDLGLGDGRNVEDIEPRRTDG